MAPAADGPPAQRFRLRKGLDIPLSGAPAPVADAAAIPRAQPARHVAYVGLDVRGPKRLPTLEVAEGDRVRLGQPITRRKAYRQVVGTAPGSGVVEAIHRGPRRVLETVVIRLDDPEHDPNGADQETFNAYSAADLDGLSRDQVIENLTASGAWLALRTRPFSMIADPGLAPAAMFVTAMDSQPLAADPTPMIRAHGEAFADGLRVLAKLTDGPLYVCTRPDAGLALPALANLRLAELAGPHPAGLPGTHIHLLRPASLRHQVWHIGWQDVIAAGRLFRTGRVDPTRIIALAGPMVANPRVLRTRVGASTNDLIQGELKGPHEARVVSGSALTGRQAVGTSAYLGRFHNQVTVLPEERERAFLGWIMPGRGRYSAMNLFWSRRGGDPLNLGTSLHGSPRAMVPVGAYERVMPLDLLPTQLLRALLVNDVETAEALGALELDEEDLALLSFVDCGKHDYGPALRRNLEQIRHEHG
ncbi:MAG: Na(+)-translocating NADH-quinone reductase subunit A [Gammaproteobacteria bacterium]|nr:Na(+)-translocating NADH-quinone reductase subunit A [Gammaproteobacteria bacterium]